MGPLDSRAPAGSARLESVAIQNFSKSANSPAEGLASQDRIVVRAGAERILGLVRSTATAGLAAAVGADLEWPPLRGEAAALVRKEVIQPQVPLRLPCYDLAPVTGHTIGGCLPCGLAYRLPVQQASMA